MIAELFEGIFSGMFNHLSNISGPESIIFDIAIILIVSAVFALIARLLKQPLIPAYVLAGLVIGPLFAGFVKNTELIYAFSEIGIAFLLFTAGLEISFRKIKEANLKKIILIGSLQVLFIFLIAVFAGKFFGLNDLQSAYIGIILAFGSTMVVIKLLSDKGELVTLHGRLILGILLLQDLVAIIAIVVFTAGGFALIPISIALIKLLAIVLIAVLIQRFILDPLFRFASHTTELLFISSLGILFLFVILAYFAELSIVIGAFIAGVILANSAFKLELESRISPLRDFFAILFFVSLGMQLVFTGISQHIGLFIFLLGVGFIIKPIITFILLRITGYMAKTSFLTAISLAQLSEFSLIIGMIGVGVLEISIFSTIILATIITMAFTPYFIKYKNGMFKLFKTPARILQFLPIKETLPYTSKSNKSVLLIGCHRMGSILLQELMKNKKELLVMDHDPEIISLLTKKRVSCIYGGLSSPELLDNVNLEKLKLVISTAPDYDENLFLLKKIKGINSKTIIILTASRISEAKKLYEEGADYVILPKILAGDEMLELLKKKKSQFLEVKERHLRNLKDIHNILY